MSIISKIVCSLILVGVSCWLYYCGVPVAATGCTVSAVIFCVSAAKDAENEKAS